MLTLIDKIRLDVSSRLDGKVRSAYGQYFTPSTIANFMASLFDKPSKSHFRILDAGAGVGALSLAMCERLKEESVDLSKVEITAYEIDCGLAQRLEEVLSCQTVTNQVHIDVRNVDFIEDAVSSFRYFRKSPYTHAILNPPYKKMAAASKHRRWLGTVGIETVNLYSAFAALSVLLLEPKGELVAIIPRSFCNGPYYRPFRNLILRECAIRSIHLFDSRDKAFCDDAVLQENVIVHLQRGVLQGNVNISTSSDASFSDLERRVLSFDDIVSPNDEACFFHIPIPTSIVSQQSNAFCHSLKDLDIDVSTGPVVDFRAREYVSKTSDSGTVPLLYPGHFVDELIEWPKVDWKRSNAIVTNKVTRKWLYPSGFYTVVRRFSSKEEKRRINASLVNPFFFDGFDSIGFENRLNVFHYHRTGLDELLCFGLAAYLNTSSVDVYFRQFNGHTQVNATDLRALKYPDVETLQKLGLLAKRHGFSKQETVDALLGSFV